MPALLSNALIALLVAIVWHVIVVNNLSLVTGRYRGARGQVVNSIALHPLHLAGLALTIIAGLLMCIPVPESILPFQLALAVTLATTDAFLVLKAIKSVDRFAD